MEANEAQELQEQHEQAAGHPSLRPVSFTMSVLAVLVAIVTVLGHRSHTEAVLSQAQASDQWNFYQSHKNRQYDTQLAESVIAAMPGAPSAATRKVLDKYESHERKWDQDLKQSQDEARSLEKEVRRAERKANRFDLGEALLEIGLVVTSITLLTRQRSYWYLGMAFGGAGVVAAALAFVLR